MKVVSQKFSIANRSLHLKRVAPAPPCPSTCRGLNITGQAPTEGLKRHGLGNAQAHVGLESYQPGAPRWL